MLKKPREYWELGQPISEAWRCFCAPAEREQLNSPEIELQPSFNDPARPFLSLAISTLSAVGQLAHSHSKQRALLERMQHRLIEALQGGAWVAFAFLEQPYALRTPNRIAQDFWRSADVDFAGGSAEGAERIWRDVRVLNVLEHPELAGPPKIGRPTQEDKILAAINSVDCPDFRKLRNKQKWEEIRKSIKLQYPNIDIYGQGLGDDAIRKHYSKYCQLNPGEK